MMNIEFKVNGSLVGNIYLHNEGNVDSGKDLCQYYWHVYHMDYDGTPVTKEGRLEHKRTDGMFKLCSLICEEIGIL